MPVNHSLLFTLTDTELADALGVGVAERVEVHRWPLSCVQRLRLDDGTSVAYKAQLQPSLEMRFYAAARSPLLLPARVLSEGPCSHLVLPWVTRPSLAGRRLPAAELAETVTSLTQEIAAIEGELPTYLDLASRPGIHAIVERVLDMASVLIGDGRLPSLTTEDLAFVSDWVHREPIVHALNTDRAFTNGGLSANQVFLPESGTQHYTVIDWERPVWATAGMDVVSVLIDAGHDPADHLDWPPIGAYWLQLLHWAVTAQYDFFPDQAGRSSTNGRRRRWRAFGRSRSTDEPRRGHPTDRQPCPCPLTPANGPGRRHRVETAIHGNKVYATNCPSFEGVPRAPKVSGSFVDIDGIVVR